MGCIAVSNFQKFRHFLIFHNHSHNLSRISLQQRILPLKLEPFGRMKPPCGEPKLLRWKVKDLASSCFSCRFPLEEETDNTPPCGSPQEKLITTATFPGQKAKKPKPSSVLKYKTRGRRLAAEPRFADEDYIVFCFREDGAIRMINEGRSSDGEYPKTGSAEPPMTSSSEFRQLHCDCDECLRWSTWDASASNNERDGEMRENNQSDIKDGENRSIGWPAVKETQEMEQPSGSKMESFESCESNLSDSNTSSSSFAFPVLVNESEWIGSPVHMPKWEDDATSPQLHCCRF